MAPPTDAVRHRIACVDPGSTSTKAAVFDGEREVFSITLLHDDAALTPFLGRPVLDQLPMRLAAVREALAGAGFLRPAGPDGMREAPFDAVAGRGGLLRPLESGTYAVDAAMFEDLLAARRGEHASNLGAFLAHELAGGACPAFIVDPVSVDEWPPVARLSGLAGLDRDCLSHALNTKAVARRFARETGRAYAASRLVVAHLGTGISVSAHRDGRMVEVCNSREEGPFGLDRAGALPVLALLRLATSPGEEAGALERRIFGRGGVYSYLGTRDLREVYRRIDEGDTAAATVLEAMVYQTAREIAGTAAVLEGRVDAILLTGGMARSERLVSDLTRRVAWVAAVHVFPGEDELRALAEGALRVLRGEEPVRVY